MDNQVFQQVRGLIDKNDAIGIVVGRDPSLDEMAGALGLFLSLKELGKNPVIASPTEPIVSISSLVGIDKVKTAFDNGSSGDLVVSFPYKEGEIEKISYTMDDGFLNIVVKAGEQGLFFNEKSVVYKRSGGNAPSLLFVVGTPMLSALGNLFDPRSLKETTVVNIDNKANNQGFGDIVLVSPKMSSVSEQVADLLEAIGMSIEQDIAQNLLSGIAFATRNFQDPKTSSMAFEMSGILMRKGAKRAEMQIPRPASSQQFIPSPRPNNRVQIQQRGQQNPMQTQNQPRGGQNQPQAQPSVQPIAQNNPPDDWLMPKVYKGSTNV